MAVRWRPFNVRKLFVEQANIPFPKEKAAKVAHMWRDIERRARLFGLGWSGVPPYPVDRAGLANRVGVLAGQQGWGPDFARAAYQAWFIDHLDFGKLEVLSPLLLALGQDAQAVVAQADSPAGHAAFEAETDVARSLGIFGAPSFVVGAELFWGHDRLDDALLWAQGRHP